MTILTLRVILVASGMVVCSVHCHSKWDCTGGVILKLIGITFSTRLDEAQLTKHAHRKNCVTDKVGNQFSESNIHSKPLQESSILSVRGKQCNGDHGAKCQYLISDTLMLLIMMSIYIKNIPSVQRPASSNFQNQVLDYSLFKLGDPNFLLATKLHEFWFAKKVLRLFDPIRGGILKSQHHQGTVKLDLLKHYHKFDFYLKIPSKSLRFFFG